MLGIHLKKTKKKKKKKKKLSSPFRFSSMSFYKVMEKMYSH